MATETDVRMPPHDPGAEVAVVASMLIDPPSIATASELLRADDFYGPGLADLFVALVALAERGVPADVVTVVAELGRRGALERCGGRDRILDLMTSGADYANLPYYAKIVRQKSTARRLIRIADAAVGDAYGPGVDVAGLVARLQSDVYGLSVTTERSRVSTLATAGADVLARARRIAAGEEHPGIPTGFVALDGVLGGLRKGQLIVIAADTSAGKTALGLSIAINAAELHRTVMYVSAEMAATELTCRVLAARTGLSSGQVRTGGGLGPGDRELLEQAQRDTAGWDFEIQSGQPTVGEIALSCRRMASRIGRPVELVAVDYCQLLRPESGDSRAEQVASIARGLKNLAIDLACPVVLLSQLGRESTRPGMKPTLHGLRDSSEIEQAADVVLLLYRPDEAEKDVAGLVKVQARVAKHRDGPLTWWDGPSAITLMFQPRTASFTASQCGA